MDLNVLLEHDLKVDCQLKNMPIVECHAIPNYVKFRPCTLNNDRTIRIASLNPCTLNDDRTIQIVSLRAS